MTQQDAISCHQTISLLTSLNSKHRHQTLATALLTLQLSAIALYQLQQSHHLGSDFQRNACFDKLTIPTTCLWKAHLTHTVNTVWVTLFLVQQIFFFKFLTSLYKMKLSRHLRNSKQDILFSFSTILPCQTCLPC